MWFCCADCSEKKNDKNIRKKKSQEIMKYGLRWLLSFYDGTLICTKMVSNQIIYYNFFKRPTSMDTIVNILPHSRFVKILIVLFVKILIVLFILSCNEIIYVAFWDLKSKSQSDYSCLLQMKSNSHW